MVYSQTERGKTYPASTPWLIPPSQEGAEDQKILLAEKTVKGFQIVALQSRKHFVRFQVPERPLNNLPHARLIPLNALPHALGRSL
jgi:hypothetical protein